jgi:hypothetical protein
MRRDVLARIQHRTGSHLRNRDRVQRAKIAEEDDVRNRTRGQTACLCRALANGRCGLHGGHHSVLARRKPA